MRIMISAESSISLALSARPRLNVGGSLAFLSACYLGAINVKFRVRSGERMIWEVSGIVGNAALCLFFSPLRSGKMVHVPARRTPWFIAARDVRRAKTLSVCAHLACTLFRQTSAVPLPTTHRPLGRKQDWWEYAYATILSRAKENSIAFVETSISSPFIIRLREVGSWNNAKTIFPKCRCSA